MFENLIDFQREFLTILLKNIFTPMFIGQECYKITVQSQYWKLCQKSFDKKTFFSMDQYIANEDFKTFWGDFPEQLN